MLFVLPQVIWPWGSKSIAKTIAAPIKQNSTALILSFGKRAFFIKMGTLAKTMPINKKLQIKLYLSTIRNKGFASSIMPATHKQDSADNQAHKKIFYIWFFHFLYSQHL